MRIPQVRFKNINALIGEWEIDLTHSVFESYGIVVHTFEMRMEGCDESHCGAWRTSAIVVKSRSSVDMTCCCFVSDLSPVPRISVPQ
jgi:hypothetical protein